MIVRPRLCACCAFGFITAIAFLAFTGCHTQEPEPAVAPQGQAAARPGLERPSEPLRNEIPPTELPVVMAAHFKGVGYMEQYEYGAAVKAFREVQARAPGWIPGSINLAIALLNDTGVKVEQAKKAGGDAALGNFDEALNLLASVLEREPENPHAHFCRGIILEQQGRLAEAHKHFLRVTEIDPNDATGWYWAGSTLTDRDNPTQPAGPNQAKEQIAFFVKALERNPYMTPALYKMAMSSRFTDMKTSRGLFEQWRKINPDRPDASPGPGDSADKKYGDMGKYADVINPFPRIEEAAKTAPAPLKFEGAQPLRVTLPAGQRWVKPSDFDGAAAIIGRARARFGAPAAVFDADGDGQLDLFLPSALIGPKGIHDTLLLNKGDGSFQDASASFGLPDDRSSLGAAAADFDADRHIDLFLTGAGANVLLRNRDGKSFENVSSIFKQSGPPAVSLMARWLDLDQDGDLDLYVVNHCAVEHADRAFRAAGEPPPGLANSAYRNDGQPDPASGATLQNRTPIATAYGTPLVAKGLTLALTSWTEATALVGGARAHTGIALLDVDGDRDLDLVLTAEKTAPVAILNDRLGQFHEAAIGGLPVVDQVSGILASDFDADGRTDLVAPAWNGRVFAWKNTTVRSTAATTMPTFESWPINAINWLSAQAIDLDLDGFSDLLGLPASTDKPGEMLLPAWARNEGSRFTAQILPLNLPNPGVIGLAAVDLIGDALPDILVIRAGEAPALARNLGNGQNWLALKLGGHWRVKPELMRTNSHAIGTRVLVEGQGLHVNYDHTTPDSGLSQSIAPVVLGLGHHDQAALVHLRWPDGVMQCELNVVANQKLDLAENNRKTGSCPVLFTWNGKRFVCVGDFLGGGGLGYLVAPGNYSQPDRDEAMAVTAEQLQPSDGVFRLSVTEPMDEVAYLDHLSLDVVDSPPGVSTALDERFAPEGPRPTGALMAWRTAIEPVRAVDIEGRDITELLRQRDRRTVDTFRKRDGWIGYAFDHGIIVDFGDRLSRYGLSDRLVLCLAGWVEYPYSQTNYAAATAGVALQPPAIERQRADGAWEMIEPHAGYPAGLPRLMTLDLTGKLSGPKCALRIKTNMECYYDQVFVVVRDQGALDSVRVSTLPVQTASIGHRGYTREISPDGLQPLIYDYEYVDPAPLASFRGKLTRHGDVTRLLTTDDDEFCVVGPGDEVQIEFPASGLPALPPNWTRSYVVRGIGYCKDADPFTATSDSIEPLPWRGMPAFPFGPEVKRPANPAHDAYLRAYQNRTAGAGG
jgi:tetratricopeptide (TPR) repeat protein